MRVTRDKKKYSRKKKHTDQD
ncbi:MAG: hypothetical protein ACPGE6_00190 [Gammaproteobacteria bacterium]